MSKKNTQEYEVATSDFGINYLERMDIWTRALNKAFESLELPVEVDITRYMSDRDDVQVKDRIMIEVKRT